MVGVVGWVVMAHEISGIKAPIILHGWVGVGWVVVGWGGGVGGDGVGWAVVEGWWVVWLYYLSNQIQIPKNHCRLNEGLKI